MTEQSNEQKNELIEDNLIDDLMSKSKINLDLVYVLLKKGGNFTNISIRNSYNVVDTDLLILLFSKTKEFDQDTITHLILYGKLIHIKLLLKNNNVFFTKNHFLDACKEGDVELIQLVLSKLKISLDNNVIKEAITIASNYGNIDLVKFLLEYK